MKGILIYLVIAFGGAWLLALPLWLSGQGLATPGTTLILVGMMFIPTLAALIASRVSPPTDGFMRTTGLRAARPFRAWWRYALIAWLMPIVAMVAALTLAWMLGIFHVDLVNFSGFAAQVHALSGGKPLPMSLRTLVALQLVGILVAPFINAIPALGEEIGWRGFLLPRLCRFGQWPATILTGVIWGLWHAPAILLGFNYPGVAPLVALAFMVIFCVLLSVLFGWLRLASGSIWPSAIAHGCVNAVAGLGMLVAAAGHPVDNVSTGLLGWTGWIVLVLVIAGLVVTKRFPVRHLESPQETARKEILAGNVNCVS
jgi:membrane protease YdiL (CAAX protease family)